jgi:5'-methylthioadenosine phosphorylase
MVVKGILAINAVGTIIADLEPGDLVPHAFVGFTKLQSLSFYNDLPVTHVSMSQPFCLEIRDILVKALEICGKECGIVMLLLVLKVFDLRLLKRL